MPVSRSLPRGVRPAESGRHVAYIKLGGRQRLLGCYAGPDTARTIYRRMTTPLCGPDWM